MSEHENAYVRIYNLAKKYFGLQLEYAKLTAAEKLTLLIGALATGIIVVMLLMVMMLFLSLWVSVVLAHSIGAGWAYALMAAFYLLMIVLLTVFRKPLIFNPISRFVTKMFL